MFEDLIAEYNRLEPPGTDAWTPSGKESELWHRIRLFIALGWALEQIPVPVSELKVLDVGCGVGRSTRALLEFGINPSNVLGIDLRASAIEYAKIVNPSIPFRVTESYDNWPPAGTFHLCIQCTAFSSITGNDRRLSLAQMMEKMVMPDGFIFWWDRILANDFAGSDVLDPSQMFMKSILLKRVSVPLKPRIAESLKTRNYFIKCLLPGIQKYFGYRSTHIMAIFRKLPMSIE